MRTVAAPQLMTTGQEPRVVFVPTFQLHERAPLAGAFFLPRPATVRLPLVDCPLIAQFVPAFVLMRTEAV